MYIVSLVSCSVDGYLIVLVVVCIVSVVTCSVGGYLIVLVVVCI